MAKKQASLSARVLRMVLIDLLVFGLALCAFSYFHHGRQEAVTPIAMPPSVQQEATEPPVVTETPAPATPDPSAPPEETPEPTQEPTGLLRGKYADKFSDTVHRDETSYRSKDVSLTLTEEHRYDSLIHVIDVYVQDITSIRTVVCKDQFGGNKSAAELGTLLPDALAVSSSDQFRNRNREQWGLVVGDGNLYSDNTRVYDFAVLFNDGTMKVYQAGQATLEELAAKGIRQAWTFGPALIQNGEMTGDYDGAPARMQNKNPRVAIGYYEPGHYCLVMVDGSRGSNTDSKGATLDELSELLSELGCVEALNLDGGGTVGMSFLGRALNIGSRALTNAIYISEPETAAEGN